MTTALDIISDALQKIGVYAPSETINDADANRAFVVLNDLIDTWREEYLYVYVQFQRSIETTPGKFVYSIGSLAAADIQQPRPPRVTTGPGAATSSTTVTSIAAAAVSPLNYPILTFADTTDVAIGQSVVNATNPGALAMGTVVTAASPTTVTISPGPKGAGVQVADVIVFGTPPTGVNVVTAVEWQTLTALGLPSGQPDTLYYNPEYPLGQLFLSPIPTDAGEVVFDAWQVLPGFTNLFFPDVTLAAGADNALKLNLAVVLKNYFNDAVVPAEVVNGARQTRKMISYTNITSRAMMRRGMPAAPPPETVAAQ